MKRCRPSTSRGMHSTASGITPLRQINNLLEALISPRALRRCGTPITDEVGSTLTRQRAGACAFRRSRPGIGGAPTPVTDDAVSAGVLLEADILFPGWSSGLGG